MNKRIVWIATLCLCLIGGVAVGWRQARDAYERFALRDAWT